mmetsp:Transcript_60714/g.188240  ORF Transcript_60714/g.188240 Transcript_60714/m.188240 type:complete len:324 (+) Transcript_60714:346-1317(+)
MVVLVRHAGAIKGRMRGHRHAPAHAHDDPARPEDALRGGPEDGAEARDHQAGEGEADAHEVGHVGAEGREQKGGTARAADNCQGLEDAPEGSHRLGQAHYGDQVAARDVDRTGSGHVRQEGQEHAVAQEGVVPDQPEGCYRLRAREVHAAATFPGTPGRQAGLSEVVVFRVLAVCVRTERLAQHEAGDEDHAEAHAHEDTPHLPVVREVQGQDGEANAEGGENPHVLDDEDRRVADPALDHAAAREVGGHGQGRRREGVGQGEGSDTPEHQLPALQRACKTGGEEEGAAEGAANQSHDHHGLPAPAVDQHRADEDLGYEVADC